MIRGERRAMIRSDIPGLSLSRQCQILSISRSLIYYRPRGESPENLALMRRIDELFLKYPFYGSRQMVRHLAREGPRVGRHRIRRLMRLMELQAIYRAPRTSKPHPEHRIHPYLLRGLTITRPDHVWCADITYIPDLRPGAARLPLSGGDPLAGRRLHTIAERHGLDQPPCVGLAPTPWTLGSASRP